MRDVAARRSSTSNDVVSTGGLYTMRRGVEQRNVLNPRLVPNGDAEFSNR